MKRRLSFRLAPLYLAAFLQAFNLWYAIEKMFMRGIGFDDAAIALAVALFTVVTLLVEAPSGILADRWSRKGVLIIASVAMIFCSVIAGLSETTWMYMMALVFIGVYYAMYSGAYEAVVYDTLVEESGSGKGFEKYYGRLQALSSLALVSGSLLSGLISHFYGLQAVYFLTVPFMVLSIIVLVLFKEPHIHKAAITVPVHRQLHDTYKALTKTAKVRWCMLGLILLTISSGLIFEFNQLWYLALGMAVVFYAATGALVQACLGIGGLLAGYLRQTPVVTLLCSTLIIFCATLLTVSVTFVVIIGLVVLQSLLVALTILVARQLHDAIPSNNRAGVVSAISTISKLCFIPAALLFGLISRQQSVFESAWILVVLALLLTPVLVKIFRVSPHAIKTPAHQFTN